MIFITADYMLTLMRIKAGEIPAPPEVVEQAKERLEIINEFLKEEEQKQ